MCVDEAGKKSSGALLAQGRSEEAAAEAKREAERQLKLRSMMPPALLESLSAQKANTATDGAEAPADDEDVIVEAKPDAAAAPAGASDATAGAAKADTAAAGENKENKAEGDAATEGDKPKRPTKRQPTAEEKRAEQEWQRRINRALPVVPEPMDQGRRRPKPWEYSRVRRRKIPFPKHKERPFAGL